MATIRILLGIICLIALGQFTNPHRDIITAPHFKRDVPIPSEIVLAIARAEVGVKEATGGNDGKRVEAYLAVTGLKRGNPWCAAFISWVFKQAGAIEPRTAWSPELFPLSKRKVTVKPAMLFGIYFSSLKRIAHCGFVEAKVNHWIITIEGNTNIAGSREGDGVCRKRRHMRTIKCYADWLNRKGVDDE